MCVFPSRQASERAAEREREREREKIEVENGAFLHLCLYLSLCLSHPSVSMSLYLLRHPLLTGARCLCGRSHALRFSPLLREVPQQRCHARRGRHCQMAQCALSLLSLSLSLDEALSVCVCVLSSISLSLSVALSLVLTLLCWVIADSLSRKLGH